MNGSYEHVPSSGTERHESENETDVGFFRATSRFVIGAFIVALSGGLAAHLLHVGNHAGHDAGLSTGIYHWLRDSLFAVPVAVLVIFFVGEITNEAGRLVLTIDERPQIRQITISGTEEISEAEVKAALLDGFTERLGVMPYSAEATLGEENAARRILDEEVGTDEFVAEIDDPSATADTYVASHTGAGGTITCYVRLEGPRQDRIREILITGDFFVTPPRFILDLEAALRGVDVRAAQRCVTSYFDSATVEVLSVTQDDFLDVIEQALAQSAHGPEISP